MAAHEYPVDPYWYAVLARVRDDPGVPKSYLYANDTGRRVVDRIIASGTIEGREERGRIGLYLTPAGELLLATVEAAAVEYGGAVEGRGMMATIDETNETRLYRLYKRRREEREKGGDRCVLNRRLITGGCTLQIWGCNFCTHK